jgi:hypothetical protein
LSQGINGVSPNQNAAVADILRYLIKHPQAKDTIEGINRWWLAQADSMSSIDDVQEAVDFLVSRGWMERKTIGFSGDVYAVKEVSLREASEFLKSLLSPGGGNQRTKG